MEYYAIYIPDKKPDFSIKSFYNVKAEALAVLKQHKEARMKAFPSSEEAVYFYLNGPTETFVKPATPTVSSPRPLKSPFVAPTSQKLVAFRKLIEANNISEVLATIQNPRYLVSSGDTPTILKEGPRYNALHIAAIENRGEVCRLILQTIECSAYIEKLHGLRTTSTDEVSAILLDLYLNTPDKCRSETPLHFAAKHGSVEVVKELIAYPQCQVVPNADGLFPRDIICTRAKPSRGTPEVRESIRVLLDEHFFVPLVRYEDNLIPPTVGKPFSPTRPIKLDEPGSPTISPRGEVKAYAGPMDRSKADSFYRRWKTPPRLVVVSPRLLQVRSEEQKQHSSSTPIKAGHQPRRLFANRSLDHALFDGAPGGDKSELENNNIDESRMALDDTHEADAMANASTTSLLEPIEEDQTQDNNGNNLLSSPVVSTPIRLFHQYRNLANDMDSTVDSDASLGEANFSYLCDETRTVYDRSRLRDTPTHKERALRLSNIDKGLETLGRMLATNESVGWKEHWAFLGKFCDLANDDGLRMFEEFLEERQRMSLAQPAQPSEEAERPLTFATMQPLKQSTLDAGKDHRGSWMEPFADSSSSINSLCDNMQKFSLREPGPAGGMMAPTEAGEAVLSTQSQLANPYVCVTSSLKVLATRFLMILQNAKNNAPEGTRLNGAVHNTSSFLHVVQKLDTMVENFRADAAFREIDLEKAHTLFAYLILALAGNRTAVPKGVLFAPLLSATDEGSLVPSSGGVACSFECIKHSLMHTMYDRLPMDVKLIDETENDCRRLWQEERLISACGCRPQIGFSLAMRRKERVKRREERSKGAALGEFSSLSSRGLWNTDPTSGSVVVDYKTYRTLESTPSPPNTPPGSDILRSARGKGFGLSSEEEDIYLSCSDSDEDMGYGPDDDDVFFTPPSSPTALSTQRGTPWDTNNNAELMREDMQNMVLERSDAAKEKDTPPMFITGIAPTKQDFDVWTALAGVEIDRNHHPLVHAWKEAMREHTKDKDESKGLCGF